MTDYKSLTPEQLISAIDAMTGMQIQDELMFNDNFLEAVENSLSKFPAGSRINCHYLYYRICKDIETYNGKRQLHREVAKKREKFDRAMTIINSTKDDWNVAFTSMGISDKSEVKMKLNELMDSSKKIIEEYGSIVPQKFGYPFMNEINSLRDARTLLDGTLLCSIGVEEWTAANAKKDIKTHIEVIIPKLREHFADLPKIVDEFETYFKDMMI